MILESWDVKTLVYACVHVRKLFESEERDIYPKAKPRDAQTIQLRNVLDTSAKYKNPHFFIYTKK